MAAIEDIFAHEYAAWRTHCKENLIHSNPHFYTDCVPFRKIVSLGKRALPLIQRAYAQENGKREGDPFHHWAYVIKEIVPEFELQGKKQGVMPREGFVALDVNQVQKATLEWLDEYLVHHPVQQ